MRIALGLAFLLAACGHKSAAPATPGTNGSGMEMGSGHHDGEMDGMTPEMTKFHDVLKPLWHSEKGAERMQKSCAAVPEFQADADAIAKATPPTTANADKWTEGTRALVAGVTGLADACTSNDSAKFETAFQTMHDAFHSLMMQAGMMHGEEGMEGMQHEGMHHEGMHHEDMHH